MRITTTIVRHWAVFVATVIFGTGAWGEFVMNRHLRSQYQNGVVSSIQNAETLLVQDESSLQEAVDSYRMAIQTLDANPAFVEEIGARWHRRILANAAFVNEMRTREAYVEYIAKEERRDRAYGVGASKEPLSAQEILDVLAFTTEIARRSAAWEPSGEKVLTLRSGANAAVYPLWALRYTQEEGLLQATYNEAVGLAIEAVLTADTLLPQHFSNTVTTTSYSEDRGRLSVVARSTMEFLLRPPRNSEGQERQPQMPQPSEGRSDRRRPAESPSWGEGEQGPPQRGFGDLTRPAQGERPGMPFDSLPLPAGGVGSGRGRSGH